jgi:hypothetical protein
MKFFEHIGRAISTLNPNDVRAMAVRNIVIGVAAASDPGYDAIARFLSRASFTASRLREQTGSLYVIGEPEAPESFDMELYEEGLPCPEHAFTYRPRNPQRTIAEVLERKQELGLPLARNFPVFRAAVTGHIVRTVAKENTLFAIASALPNIAPGIALPWAIGEFASDTAFLTANQLRMAFLLAGACDREVGYREQKAEVASVIAGAFGWRALARELLGKIPFGGGVVPKAAIAYAATWVVGRSLERLYTIGYHYSRAERRHIYGEGFERGKAIASRLLEKFRASRRTE